MPKFINALFIFSLLFTSVGAQANPGDWPGDIYYYYLPMQSRDVNYLKEARIDFDEYCQQRELDLRTQLYILEVGEKPYNAQLTRHALYKAMSNCKLRMKRFNSRIQELSKTQGK